jgi:hypothetical protein
MPFDRLSYVRLDVPSRPFPILGDEQMVEKVQFLNRGHPNVGMAPQLNPEPRRRGFLDSNAKEFR